MPLILKIDKQGRIVLPKDVRQALGIEGDSDLVCRVIGGRIILERFSSDKAHEAFTRLEEIAPSLDLDRAEVGGGIDKYVDREYALRKIGFRSGS
ncbi:MAG: AbrB/MazE/SpoVT family DNA-binding domain-containing protein [Candidatus Bathyarchaeia archaeon]